MFISFGKRTLLLTTFLLMTFIGTHADDSGLVVRGERARGSFQHHGGEYNRAGEFGRGGNYAHPEARAYENGAAAGAAVGGVAGAAVGGGIIDSTPVETVPVQPVYPVQPLPPS